MNGFFCCLYVILFIIIWFFGEHLNFMHLLTFFFLSSLSLSTLIHVIDFLTISNFYIFFYFIDRSRLDQPYCSNMYNKRAHICVWCNTAAHRLKIGTGKEKSQKKKNRTKRKKDEKQNKKYEIDFQQQKLTVGQTFWNTD